jgi:hypothetical protein
MQNLHRMPIARFQPLPPDALMLPDLLYHPLGRSRIRLAQRGFFILRAPTKVKIGKLERHGDGW